MIRIFGCLLIASAIALPQVALARTHHAKSTKSSSTRNSAAKEKVERPSVLGQFKDWGAYSRGTGDSKVCYALSEPKSTDPTNVKRDKAYFLINDWPSRKSKGEPEIVPGYQYRDGSPVTVQVGEDKFTFFTKNQDGAGGAWVLNAADESKLISAMRSGGIALVTGTSTRGTVTHDSYSLAGISDAVDKIHDACGM